MKQYILDHKVAIILSIIGVLLIGSAIYVLDIRHLSKESNIQIGLKNYIDSLNTDNNLKLQDIKVKQDSLKILTDDFNKQKTKYQTNVNKVKILSHSGIQHYIDSLVPKR